MPAINWAQYDDQGLGLNAPVVAYHVNRPLRELLTNSGYSPDSATLDLRTISGPISIALGNISVSNDDTTTGMTGTKYTNNTGTGSGYTYRGRSASGTIGAPGPTKAGQVIANFTGHATPDGVNFFGHCEIILIATQDHDATHRGTKMTFGITPHNGTIRADAWKIASTDPDNPHLQPNDGFADLVDLGQSANRVRSGYFGTSVVVGGSGAGLVEIKGNAGTVRDLIWTTAGSRRWHARCNTAAEGGSNAGSDFVLRAYADDGATPVADVLTITRSTGQVLLGGNLNLASGKIVLVTGVQVLTARKTGWATATGTPTRTTFDTASVTLPQLAEHVKALIDDLHNTAGHGLIGT